MSNGRILKFTAEDVESIELAARAAGYEAERDGDAIFVYDAEGGLWDPLRDDGDALRLAIKLQLTIHNEHVNAGATYCTGVGYESDGSTFPEVSSGGNEDHVIPDDYAATRRAIVLAAAEIGKTM